MKAFLMCGRVVTQLTRHYHGSSNLVSQLQHESKHILVMAGAGLSTASGIPDFRSPESGMYSNLQKYNLPFPEAIFDIDYYQENPPPFLELAKSIYPGAGVVKPNVGHFFVRLLELKEKLLRMYTQNIDGLERMAGVSEDKLVEAHGSFATASCVYCRAPRDSEVVKEEIMAGKEPRCDKCKALVKPDIIFFGQVLPERFSVLSENDVYDTDFLIVIGTSLEVHPFAGLANLVPDNIPRLLINREVVGSFGHRPYDYVRTGDIVEEVTSLVQDLGWQEELDELMAAAGGKN